MSMTPGSLQRNKEMDLLSPRKPAEPASAGRRKAAAALLPAFEPLSSSPGLPKPLKRSRDVFEGKESLPTPMPTSSTHILSSSPPNKSLARSLFKATERVPLGALPVVRVKDDDTSTKLGRSSQACDYQLSANRLISRVHVEVSYVPAVSRLGRERLEIYCVGWNGVKVHCQSKVYELRRGATFSSDIREAEIMLDIHDSRIILEWPEKASLGIVSGDEDDFTTSPTKKLKPMRRHSTPPSPSPIQNRKLCLAIPISPSPIGQLLPSSPPLFTPPELPPVDIFEDPEPLEGEPSRGTSREAVLPGITKDSNLQSVVTQSSDPSSTQTFSDNDEENDPIIHSFGPFGANLLPRMAAVTAGSSPIRVPHIKPTRLTHSEPLQPISSPLRAKSHYTDLDVQSHVVNQLAFSRLSSLPLSTILSHLPHDAQTISLLELREIISTTPCIGEVARQGKDAAGKKLENEFYYVPDADDDTNRKQAVVNDLRKPGLRACRRQHKQYYWKKPK